MKKIRVAVIGVGYLGRLHAQKYSQMEEAELVGVADTDIKRAAEVAESSNTKAYPSYEGLFGHVDAVSIVTPTESHCRIGLEFLSRGIDILVEKPIAMDAEEATRLIAEAERTNAILQVGHLERFNSAIVALRERVDKPRYIEARRLSPFPNRSTDVDVILDLMIHDIDIVLSLAGSGVATVEAVGLPVVSRKVDFANARLTFKNGCVANLTASRVSRERVRTIELMQSDACLSVDYANQHLFISRPVEGKGGFSPLVEDEFNIEKRDSLMEELKAFVRASAERSSPVVSGTDGKRALEVAALIQESVARAGVPGAGGNPRR